MTLPTAMIVALAIAAAIAFAVAMAFAVGPPAQSSEEPTERGSGPVRYWRANAVGTTYRASAFDLRAVHQAHLTLPQVIAAAEKEKHRQALDAFLDRHDGNMTYRILLLDNHNMIAADWINALSGKVTPSGVKLPQNQWSAMERQEVANLRHADIGLSESITIVKQHVSGRAVNAGISYIRGQPGYRIDLVNRNMVESLVVRSVHPSNTGNSSHKAA